MAGTTSAEQEALAAALQAAVAAARADSGPRGLSSKAAMEYLGVKERTWDSLRKELKGIRLGTSMVYDRRDLDALFDKLKASAKTPERPAEGSVDARSESPATTQAPKERRKWPRAVSTKNHQGAGSSTGSIGVNAYFAALNRSKTPKAG